MRSNPKFRTIIEIQDLFTDSNSLNDEGIVPHVTNSNQRQLYSSSVPISVPSWTDYRQRNSSIDEDDEEDDRVSNNTVGL